MNPKSSVLTASIQSLRVIFHHVLWLKAQIFFKWKTWIDVKFGIIIILLIMSFRATAPAMRNWSIPLMKIDYFSSKTVDTKEITLKSNLFPWRYISKARNFYRNVICCMKIASSRFWKLLGLDVLRNKGGHDHDSTHHISSSQHFVPRKRKLYM